MSIVGFIGTGGSLVKNSGVLGGISKDWVTWYRRGQDGGTVVCPDSPERSQTSRYIQNAPDEEIQWIISTLRDGNKGRAPASRAELANNATMQLWVTALLGGGNCQYDRDPAGGRLIKQRFLNGVQLYGTDDGENVSFNSYSNLGSGGFQTSEGGFDTAGDFSAASEAGLEAFLESFQGGDREPEPQEVSFQQAGFQGLGGNGALLVGGALLAAFFILK